MAHEITITPTQQGNGTIAWSLCYQLKCGGPGDPANKAYPDIMVPADGTPHEFKVTIAKPDFGITFAQDALWVAPGRGVHTGKGLDSHHQINSYTVDTGGKVLTFTDENSNMFPKWFSYGMNFVQGQKTVQPIDPDWHNGGGGFTVYFASAEAAAVTLIAMIVLLFIGFGIGRYTMGRKIGARGVKG